MTTKEYRPMTTREYMRLLGRLEANMKEAVKLWQKVGDDLVRLAELHRRAGVKESTVANLEHRFDAAREALLSVPDAFEKAIGAPFAGTHVAAALSHARNLIRPGVRERGVMR